MTTAPRVAELLTEVAQVTEATSTPADSAEARALDEAVHRLGDALAELHDGINVCDGFGDVLGRCHDCGARLKASPHQRRGCMTALPLWLMDAALSLPYFGKALWLAYRSLINRRGQR